jgi:hypothetical protein
MQPLITVFRKDLEGQDELLAKATLLCVQVFHEKHFTFLVPKDQQLMKCIELFHDKKIGFSLNYRLKHPKLFSSKAAMSKDSY